MVKRINGKLFRWWLVAALGIFPTTSQAQKTDAQHSASFGFRPAVFQGIRMGVSRKAEVLARFGKPRSETLGEDGSLYLEYRDIGIVPGMAQFTVNPRTSIVTGLDIGPTTATLKEVIGILGPGSVVTRWSEAPCTELVYIDPDGTMPETEYRHLGIAIRVRGRFVDDISYLSKPLGLDANPCQGPKKRPGSSAIRVK